MPPAFIRTRTSKPQRLIETQRLLETWHLLEHRSQAPCIYKSHCSNMFPVYVNFTLNMLILSVYIYFNS